MYFKWVVVNQKFNLFDETAMRIALKQAEIAFSRDEVPVGACLFLNGKLISTGYNRVHETKDASMHAELICLKEAAKSLSDFRLEGAILYITLEPCAMCAGAIHNFRLKKVIYGAKDLRVGAAGTLYNLFDGNHPIHKVECVGGLMEEQSAELLRKFFKMKRENKKMDLLFEEMINHQKKKLLMLAQEIVPGVTEEDILQPFDFKELEQNPDFRYEEGILHGILSTKAAFLAKI